ncbi:type I methionyl aminopeptidase [Gordonia neofelifaecis]|uniref:Methionine aminopeptidase n=1 Tax=Gordonia neofelifaecis NRRL B-59395 TaxID=644548 RepID=F1YMR4_9ACTN|nr:type I methionyl aminopeptidase [Gordonia neofelifaecis]EGD53999.1 methionine aminopeptidase, type I [Gordonia neofelifaecis NRRL B-59395]
MMEIKTPAEIAKMAVTGRFVAEVLTELSRLARPGVDVMDLEHRARAMVADRGAESCYWDYSPSFGRGPFRNVICLSVDDAVLHGLPAPHVLAPGELLTMDFAVSIDGWVADSAVTVQVGFDDDVAARPDDPDARLIDSTRRALDAGIAAAVPGGRLGDVSAAIGAVAAADGYRVNTDFGGHGLGRTMHEDPHVPNAGRAGRGLRLRPGMVLALEPWWAAGTDRIVYDPDGWTIRSADGSRTAHSEHTVAITDDGPLVLTSRG